MKTIETKIAKNGAVNTYVNGKKIAIAKAAEFALEEKIYGEKNIAIINENGETYQVSAWEISFIYRDNDVKELAARIKEFARSEIKSNAISEEIAETKSEEDTEMKNQNANATQKPAIPYEAFMTLVTGKTAEQRAAERAAEEAKWQRQCDISDCKWDIHYYESEITRTTGNLQDINNDCEKYPDDESLKAYAAELTEEIATLQTKLADTKIKLAELTHEADVEDYAVTVEAQDAAIEAEIENAARNTESKPEPKGYIFTKTLIVTGCSRDSAHHSELEHIDTYCQILGDSEHFDGSIYREAVFFNPDHAHSWAVKTADGKVIISGTSKPDFNEIKAAVNSETPAHKVTKTERITAIENETPAEPEEITFIAQNGAILTIEGGMPTIAANGNKLEVNGIWVGDYYRNEDAQIAAEALKYDVEECGDDHPVLHKFYFAECEFEESPTGGERTAEHLNANAPAGWSVTRADKKIRVDYQGKRVAEVDRITDRDLLVPHAFFQQFQPLVDKSKTPEQMFIDDRYRELAELEEMREELQHTPPISKERLKTLDDMINQVKRDIYETEMDNPDTVASICKAGAIDENGEVWF